MGKKDDRRRINQQMVTALAHPLRVEILRLLEQGPSSPTRLAARIREELEKVSYHTKVLAECGCIELVATEPSRGSIEHFYKLKARGSIGSEDWKEVPAALRTQYAGTALAEFTSRAIEALDRGTAESREGSGVVWLSLIVDERGWEELRRVLGKVEERSRAVSDKSAERMDSSTDGFPVIVAVAAFEVASGKDIDPS